ncbi:MAG: HD domain-containing protein [Clostridia bacterium]|nr:HD domain-containing protein [Clostridia bacterium]
MEEKFIELLKSTNREGMDQLIDFLVKSDFFKAPASTRFHGNHEQGLAEHSMKVYEILKHKVQTNIIPIDIPEESVIIIALLHDICKTNFYKIDYRNAKNALGVWEKVPYYTIEDTIPYGHGEKSVMMITEYIKLTPEEKYAIRWHMGYSEPKELYNTLKAAYEKYPIALLTHEADLEATCFFNT